MNPILHIRKIVLGLPQVAFAAIAGVSQATVSKWEAGELEPDRGQLARIRAHVLAAGKPWDDAWVFEAPSAPVEAEG